MTSSPSQEAVEAAEKIIGGHLKDKDRRLNASVIIQSAIDKSHAAQPQRVEYKGKHIDIEHFGGAIRK